MTSYVRFEINPPECFLSMYCVSALIKVLVISNCNFFFISSPTLIIVDFARYKETPFIAKAKIIINGITKIKFSSLSINIFLIAGSNNQAMADVLAATRIAKKTEIIILSIYNLV